ncbi:MAG: ABC transporter ATP-binding protein [Oscillospiraceae bacterium]|nr:ABC transporter ATP-binding protein [Oscillospiraceae bacterium]
MKHIVKHIKPYIPIILLSVMLIGVQAYCNLAMPDVMSQIVNVGIQEYSAKIAAASGDMALQLMAEQRAFIVATGGKMLVIALITSGVALAVQFCNAKMGTGLTRDLRKTVFTKIESFSSAEFDRFSTASLITRTTNDVQQLQMMLTMGVRTLVFAPFMGIGGVVMAMRKAPSMAWINALSVLLVLCLLITVYSLALPKFKIIQQLIDKLNLVARESLNGLLVVRAFSTQKDEEKRFDDASNNYKRTNLFVNRTMSMMGPTMGLIQNLVPVLIVWVGADKIAQSQLMVGDMMAYIQYSGNIMGAFMMISGVFIMFPRAMVSVNRVAEILDTENVINEPENPVEVDSSHREIVFDNVNFAYPGGDGDVLENISFTAKPGQTTAIIGSTGCGKTSLINLIPRFYDVTSGTVSINGVDVRNIGLKQLRDLIGYVPQKSVLLSGTIRSNLEAVKPGSSDEDILKALEIAQAKNFVIEKEDGIDAPVSQGGTNFSGGQRQRLAIARAIMKMAPIYIFDDSFSALDFTTDLNLRKALKQNLSDSTIIIVGQRVASIMDADQIIVMDDGRIVGKGTHKQLMESCEEYQQIAYSQLSKEEV